MFKNVIGLIVEYNPFHNGHLHHIQEIDRLFEDNIKIAVMSGDYVQRGEPSLINKFEKTKIALSQGVDIVIELPAFYSTQSAEIFAKGSINLLNKLSCSHIVFGSESNDLEKLKRIATISMTKEFELSLREFLAEGLSYPTAFSKALFDTSSQDDYWKLFEEVYRLVTNNPNDDINIIFNKLDKDLKNRCRHFNVLSLKYFISKIKDGLEL